MTVADLIKQLQQLDPDLDVYCVSNEGRDFDQLKGNPFRLDRVWGETGPEEVVLVDLS